MAIYLDYAASSLVRPVAQKAFVNALAQPGNPNSVHRHGQQARNVVETAREQLASVLNCDPIELIFTSGGTESVNLGIVGLYRAAVEKDARRNRIVVPEGEHHATLDTVQWLQNHEGAVIEWVSVDADARVSAEAIEEVLQRAGSQVALITLLWANNEVGTLQPVAEVAALAAAHHVPLHVDAVGAFGHVEIDIAALRAGAGEDSGLVVLSISGHKIGSVPGVGALYVARSSQVLPLIHGGGQERGLRSGTLDAPAIAAFGAAAVESNEKRDAESLRLSALRDDLAARILSAVPEAVLRGDPTERLDNNVNVTFPGCQSDSLLFLLDEQGVSVSTGSACQAGVAQPSHVLLAMGLDEAGASSALRMTLGWASTQADVDRLIDVLPGAYAKALAAGRTAS